MHNMHPTALQFGGISLYLSLPHHIPPKTSSLMLSCMFPLGCVNPEAWPVSTAGPHAKPSVMTSRLALVKVLLLIHFNLHHRKMIVCVCEGVCSGSAQHMEVAHGFVMKMENPPPCGPMWSVSSFRHNLIQLDSWNTMSLPEWFKWAALQVRMVVWIKASLACTVHNWRPLLYSYGMLCSLE